MKRIKRQKEVSTRSLFQVSSEIRSRKVDNSITPTAILEQTGFTKLNTS